ncbi:MAG: hypothetical protein EOO24_52250 [Comamonadaceae bacterium]|nr:MAG: hypothetical protein EOO24_52250 [Comamonadaceae bacterium]
MDRRDFSSARRLVCGCAAFVMTACSPVFNWRDVSLAPAELKALLPCKPDRADRSLPLGGATLQVQMAGCEAGDATFAIAHARAASPAQAEAWLAAWRASTRAQWQAAAGGGRIVEAPVVQPRAAATPTPWQIEMQGGGPDGKPTEARVRWFAHAQRDGGVAVYQATVLGKPSADDAVGTFFDGLRLP